MTVSTRALATALAASIVVVLETSKITIALPRIASEMGFQPIQTQLVTAGFLLASAVSLVPAGRLGDRFGRRTMLLWSLSLFLAGSIVATAAVTADMLVAGRIVQGLATGLVLPQTIGLIAGLPAVEQPRWHGAYGVSLAAANVLGPVLGGILVSAVTVDGGWRVVFAINLPTVLALLLLTWRHVPKGNADRSAKVDALGALLLGGLVISVLLPLLSGGRFAPGAILVPAMLVAVGLTIALVLWTLARSRRRASTIVDLRTLRSRGLCRSIAVGFGWYASVPALLLLLSLFTQSRLELSPIAASLVILPFALGAAVGSQLASRSVRIRRPWLAAMGAFLNLAGIAATLVCTSVGTVEAIYVLALSCGAAGIGGGLFSTCNQVQTFQNVGSAGIGSAAGVQQLSQRIANAAGLGVLLSLIGTAGGSAEGIDDAEYAVGLLVPLSALAIATVASLVDALRSPAHPIRTSHP